MPGQMPDKNKHLGMAMHEFEEEVFETLLELEEEVLQPQSLVIAGISAATAEILTFPIDTTKVYVQLKQAKDLGILKNMPKQIELGTAHLGLKPGGFHHMTRHALGLSLFFNTMISIYSKHGITGFYKGWIPAVLRATLNNALSASLYKPVRKLYGANNRDCPLWIKLASGLTTGSTTQIIAAPTDLLKVRLQADNARPEPRYKGVFDATKTIYKKHGLKAFWTGLIPSMARAGFAVAATFGSYDHTKSLLLKKNYYFKDDFKTHTISSLTSGFIATLVTCPIDVIKTRLQSQSIGRPKYKNPGECFQHIVKNEGFFTLWRGFGPMYGRLGPWQLAFFLTYESLSVKFFGESF